MHLWKRGSFLSLGRVCYRRFFSSGDAAREDIRGTKCRTGILLFGPGDPIQDDEIKNYFIRASLDRNIISYPFQEYLGPVSARRKFSRFISHHKTSEPRYSISKLVKSQRLDYILDILSPRTAPHMCFVGFQYTHPPIEKTLREMEIYDVERAVAVPLLPHYSCSTTGSLLSTISTYNKEKREPSKMVWSVVDRWSSDPAFINSFVESVKDGLNKFPEDVVDETLIIFSVLPTPLRNVYRGDSYHHQVAASVHCIMEKLGNCNPFTISWHSLVDSFPWLGPQTKFVLQSLESSHYKGALVVPISFISESVLADVGKFSSLPTHTKKMVHQARAPITMPNFPKGLAQLIATHLQSGSSCSKNLLMKCISCSNESCAEMRQYFRTSQEILDIAKKESSLIGWYFENHLRFAFLIELSINIRMIIHFFKDGLTTEFCKMGILVPGTITSKTKGK